MTWATQREQGHVLFTIGAVLFSLCDGREMIERGAHGGSCQANEVKQGGRERMSFPSLRYPLLSYV